jgi:hypothetical protein
MPCIALVGFAALLLTLATIFGLASAVRAYHAADAVENYGEPMGKGMGNPDAGKTFGSLQGKNGGDQASFMYNNYLHMNVATGRFNYESGGPDEVGTAPESSTPGNNVYGSFGGTHYKNYGNDTSAPMIRQPLHPQAGPAPKGHPRDAVDAGLPPCCRDKLPCCSNNWPCCQKAQYHGYTPDGKPSNLPYSQNMQGKDNVLQQNAQNQNQPVENPSQQSNATANQSKTSQTSPAKTEPMKTSPGQTMSGLGGPLGGKMGNVMKMSGNNGAAGGKMPHGAGAAGTGLLNMMSQLTGEQTPGKDKQQKNIEAYMQKTVEADNCAGIERTSAAIAINFVEGFMENFTTNSGNRWNQLRDSVFVPMGILLLLPGAILSQMKATISQGFSVLGEANPFDGILRSIVAIFLIPATYLVVNYGVDVANAMTKAVADGYALTGGGNMYEKARSGHVRAFPIRLPEEEYGVIPPDIETVMFNYFGSGPFAKLEGKLLGIKYEDPEAGIYIAPPDRAYETVPWDVIISRLAYNELNAGLAFAWAIMCCVQECYLYYLWFVGPVVAALWVYPNKMLRQALPNWVDGVLSLCFWSFFWAVTIMVMALLKGTDDTGTIMFTALNTLALLSVKAGFDSTSLVKEAAAQGKQMGERAAGIMSAAGSGMKKGGGPGPGPGPGGPGGPGGDKGGEGAKDQGPGPSAMPTGTQSPPPETRPPSTTAPTGECPGGT